MIVRKIKFVASVLLFAFTIGVFAPMYACADDCVFDMEIQLCETDCGDSSEHKNHTFHINGHCCNGHSLALLSGKSLPIETAETKDKFGIWSDDQHPNSMISSLERPPQAYLFA